MKVLFYLSLVAALVLPSSAQVQDALATLGQDLKEPIATIEQPIDETVVAIGNSQCSNVKKLVGVDYEQVSGTEEPDLNKLTLIFISKDEKVELNLTKAPQLLPEVRGYDPRAPLIIYIHGFLDDPSGPNFKVVSEAFLNTGQYILGLDASSLIRWLYPRSTTFVRFIGERLGEVLAALVQKGQEPKAIHLVGHSLGAHIAGFTGKRFLNITGGKVGRISGLDDAGPCFANVDPELRLKATDADFVDVIHTDDDVYGLGEAVGLVDFFPNGGKQQPNCLTQVCNHLFVNKLFAESITNRGAFLARACADYDAFKNNNCSGDLKVMGYYADAGTRGKYYLRTRGESPYGLGKEGAYWEDDGILDKIFG